MTLNRRGFLTGIAAALAAPAIIRTPGLLMPVRPLREPLVVGVDFGRDEGTLLFLSTPSGQENSVFWRMWMEQAERDVQRITGVNDEMLGISYRGRTSVTDETQRRLLFGNWLVGNSRFRG